MISGSMHPLAVTDQTTCTHVCNLNALLLFLQDDGVPPLGPAEMVNGIINISNEFPYILQSDVNSTNSTNPMVRLLITLLGL